MTDSVEPVSLASFNVNAVLNYFDFLHCTQAEQKSMQYLYRCVQEDLLRGRSSVSEHAQSVVHETITKMQFRYELFKLHVPHFFPLGYEPKMDALAIAVICDEYTGFINEELNEADYPDGWEPANQNTKRRDDGFGDDEAVKDAYDLFDNAVELEALGLPDDAPMPPHEVLFLAHLNAMHSLSQIEEKLGDVKGLEFADITKDLNEMDEIIKSYLCPHTSMGVALQEYRDTLERRLLGIFVPQAGTHLFPSKDPS